MIVIKKKKKTSSVANALELGEVRRHRLGLACAWGLGACPGARQPAALVTTQRFQDARREAELGLSWGLRLSMAGPSFVHAAPPEGEKGPFPH